MPSAMWWFRTNCDLPNDIRIKRLAPAERYLYCTVMHAIARQSPTPGVLVMKGVGAVTADDLAAAASPGYTASDIDTAIAKMAKLNLIDEVPYHHGDDLTMAWRITDWETTQFAVEASTPRVNNFRTRETHKKLADQARPGGAGLLTATAEILGERAAIRAKDAGQIRKSYGGYRRQCIADRMQDRRVADFVIDHHDITDPTAMADAYEAENPPGPTDAPAVVPPPEYVPDGLPDASELGTQANRARSIPRTRTRSTTR